MSRQVMDGLILVAVLVLGATHLYAQGVGGRKVIHANQAGGVTGSAARGASGPNGGASMGARGFATDGQGNAAGDEVPCQR
jgi:hypothetical protein